MHAKQFLHKLLGNAIHKSRVKVLGQLIETIITNKQLSLTKVGRSINSNAHERSNIRKVDRFLANKYYQQNSIEIYQKIVEQVVGSKKRPIIIVDWTKLPNVDHCALRAAFAAEGRAITLYEEVHPQEKHNNHKVHKSFLMHLQSLLPVDCSPIVVTDAGFKNPWFMQILKLGWDFVGRVRGKTHYGENGIYQEISTLFSKATFEPKYLGEKELTHRDKLKVGFYIVRSKLKGRKKLNSNGTLAKDKDSKTHSRGYREPWLLVSSLTSGRAKKVVNIYRRRMTIEEAFRDMKSSKYGFSMEENQTIRAQRLTVWLMLAAIASLFAWILGYYAEKQKLHYQFQANTIRDRRVLSFFYLGCRVLRKKMKIPIRLSEELFNQEALFA